MLQPPSMPSARMILQRRRAEHLVLVVGERLRRRDDDAVAGVDAHRVEVLHVADGDAGVGAVAHHLVLDLFPAEQRALEQHLVDRAGVEPAGDDPLELLRRRGDAAAGAAERVGGPDDQRQRDLLGERARLFERVDDGALDRRFADSLEQLLEQGAVFVR